MISVISIISTSVVVILIAGYAGFIIYRNIKRFKENKFCGCGCENCPNKTGGCGYNMKNKNSE